MGRILSYDHRVFSNNIYEIAVAQIDLQTKCVSNAYTRVNAHIHRNVCRLDAFVIEAKLHGCFVDVVALAIHIHQLAEICALLHNVEPIAAILAGDFDVDVWYSTLLERSSTTVGHAFART